MNRLTVDKKTENMTMVELAHNSCFAKGHEAWYRDFDREISARDLAREVMYEHAQWSSDAYEMYDRDMLDETMIENLASPVGTLEGLIAVFYRNMWAMANLRERLKEYEDAEENGLLLRLPCKVGDTLFEISEGKIRELQVMAIPVHITSLGVHKEIICQNYRGACYPRGFSEFGERVFITRGEAENKVAEDSFGKEKQ